MPVYEAVCRYILYSNGGFYIYLISFYLTHILKSVIDLRDALYSVLVPIFYISAWSVRLRKINTTTSTTFHELCMALKHDRHEIDDGPKTTDQKTTDQKTTDHDKTTGDGFLWPLLNQVNKKIGAWYWRAVRTAFIFNMLAHMTIFFLVCSFVGQQVERTRWII